MPQRVKQVATAAATVPALWDHAAVDAIPADTPAAERAVLVRQLAQQFGEHAMQSVADTIGGRRAALVQASASLLQTLLSLWVACGLSPNEIWTELHKREQLGSLLMQLNQAQSRAPRRLLKPWRIDSTKLP